VAVPRGDSVTASCHVVCLRGESRKPNFARGKSKRNFFQGVIQKSPTLQGGKHHFTLKLKRKMYFLSLEIMFWDCLIRKPNQTARFKRKIIRTVQTKCGFLWFSVWIGLVSSITLGLVRIRSPLLDGFYFNKISLK
jgi:hypothetical protein